MLRISVGLLVIFTPDAKVFAQKTQAVINQTGLVYKSYF